MNELTHASQHGREYEKLYFVRAYSFTFTLYKSVPACVRAGVVCLANAANPGGNFHPFACPSKAGVNDYLGT
ncbi:MAG: hypothetical protein K6U80_18465 [Firmicutes bacterium]|nr:hypothetical protein [Bacillota bacterium]